MKIFVDQLPKQVTLQVCFLYNYVSGFGWCSKCLQLSVLLWWREMPQTAACISAIYAMDNISGGTCKMTSDFNRSLGSGNLISIEDSHSYFLYYYSSSHLSHMKTPSHIFNFLSMMQNLPSHSQCRQIFGPKRDLLKSLIISHAHRSHRWLCPLYLITLLLLGTLPVLKRMNYPWIKQAVCWHYC